MSDSIIRGRPRHGRARSRGQNDLTVTTVKPLRIPRKQKIGDKRQTIDRTQQVLTDLQALVLTGVTRSPCSPSEIAQRAGVRPAQANSALRFLSGKGLVARTDRGWFLT